jgi:hypothetical protein
MFVFLGKNHNFFHNKIKLHFVYTFKHFCHVQKTEGNNCWITERGLNQ